MRSKQSHRAGVVPGSRDRHPGRDRECGLRAERTYVRPKRAAKPISWHPLATAAQAEQNDGSEQATNAYLDAARSRRRRARLAASARERARRRRRIGRKVRPWPRSRRGQSCPRLPHPGGMALVRARLEAAYEHASTAGPFVRAAIARGAYTLAMHEGDAALRRALASRKWAARAQATVVGPLEWAPVTALAHPTPFEAPNTALAVSYPGVAPFATSVRPTRVEADGCDLPLDATSTLDGLRAVIVDVDVPRAQTIGIELVSTSGAVVVVGGKVALSRSYDSGGDSLARARDRGRARWARARGRARRAERRWVAHRARFARRRWRTAHEPRTRVRRSRERERDEYARGVVSPGSADQGLRPHREHERARSRPRCWRSGNARAAEHLLEEARVSRPLYAHLPRSSTRARLDAPTIFRKIRAIERSRDAYETGPQGLARRVGSRARPRAAHRATARQRRGTHRSAARDSRARARRRLELDPMVRAYEAARADEGKLFDVAKLRSPSRQEAFDGTPVLAELDDAVHDRVGAEREQYACTDAGPFDAARLSCFEAKVARGDRRGALAEIARLRTLFGSPASLRAARARPVRGRGRRRGALAVYDAMLPGRAHHVVARRSSRIARRRSCKSRLLADLLTAPTCPGRSARSIARSCATPPRSSRPKGARLVAADRASRSWPTPPPPCSPHRALRRSATGACFATCSTICAASREPPTSSRARRPRARSSKGATCAASCGGASTSPTVACSSPTGRRTPRRTTPISRSSRRATTSSRSWRAGRCPARRASSSSTRPISSPSAPACTKPPSSSAGPRPRARPVVARAARQAERAHATATKRSPLSS